MSGATHIKLTGSVGVAQAERLFESARQALLAGDAVVFDCDETRDIDAAILQLMFATQRAASENELSAQLVNASESLKKSIQRYGASELLSGTDLIQSSLESESN